LRKRRYSQSPRLCEVKNLCFATLDFKAAIAHSQICRTPTYILRPL